MSIFPSDSRSLKQCVARRRCQYIRTNPVARRYGPHFVVVIAFTGEKVRLWMRIFRWLLIGVVALQGFAPALAYAGAETPHGYSQDAAAQTAPANDPAIVYAPAAVPNGVTVTIHVAPAEIAAGGMITLSGQGAPGSAEVRLAVVSAGKTLGIKDVAVDGKGKYTAEIPVEATYPVGPVQLCALALGIENAAVSCTTLVITPPAPGSVSGRLPLSGVSAVSGAAIDAQFQLMNAAGAVLYTTPLHADGSFALADVAPGHLSLCRDRARTRLVRSGSVDG